MRKRVIAGLVCLALAMTAAGCVQAESAKEIENQAASETDEGTLIEVQDIKNTESILVQGETLDMEIAYPEVVGLDDQLLEERINKTIRQAFKSEHALLAGEANVISHSYEVTHLSEDWVSIRFDFVTDPSGDGKNTYPLFTTFTVDMHTGEPILFHSLWNGLDDSKKKEFEKLVKSSVAEGQSSPAMDNASFPEAYLGVDSLIVYYYDKEMKTVEMPLESALSILF